MMMRTTCIPSKSDDGIKTETLGAKLLCRDPHLPCKFLFCWQHSQCHRNTLKNLFCDDFCFFQTVDFVCFLASPNLFRNSQRRPKLHFCKPLFPYMKPRNGNVFCFECTRFQTIQYGFQFITSTHLHVFFSSISRLLPISTIDKELHGTRHTEKKSAAYLYTRKIAYIYRMCYKYILMQGCTH